MATKKKIVLMFLGSLALFFVLSLMDEYQTVILPLLVKNRPSSQVQEVPVSVDKEAVHKIISSFNGTLSKAYLTLDASTLFDFPMDERLRQGYLKELAFLKREGRMMEMNVGHIVLEEVKGLSPFMLSVKTLEPISIRYLNTLDGSEISAYPMVYYTMNYMLETATLGWKVVRAETVKVERRDD